jgi:hypothetical protein
MRYMILIAGEEHASLNLSKEDDEKLVAAYMKYTEDLKNAGVLLSGEALQPSARGSRVTVTAGKRTVVDGPFSECKELIGGFFLIQVKSKEEALAWAARCPGAHFPGRAYVEVREVMEFPSGP